MNVDRSVLTLVHFGSNAIFAIAFLQSGLDKVFDRAGNLTYFRTVFEKTPLRYGLGLSLLMLTGFELITGSVNAAGALSTLTGDRFLGTIGAGLAMLNVLALFLGLRLAKDYAGASGLVPYFIASLLAVFFYGVR